MGEELTWPLGEEELDWAAEEEAGVEPVPAPKPAPVPLPLPLPPAPCPEPEPEPEPVLEPVPVPLPPAPLPEPEPDPEPVEDPPCPVDDFSPWPFDPWPLPLPLPSSGQGSCIVPEEDEAEDEEPGAKPVGDPLLFGLDPFGDDSTLR